MEVVVLLVAIVGITLLVVPRVQRRKAGARRTSTAVKKSRKPARARKAAAAPVVAAPAVASWSPPAAAESAGPDADIWEDDLGWEGGADAAPSPAALEAWEQWRTTDSPLAAAEAGAAPAPEVPELASVERWRAQAEEEQWVEDDDDGLGWEGEEEPPAPRALWNGEPPSPAHDRILPAPPPAALSPTPEGWNSGRDWSRRDDAHAPANPAESAPAFATASMTDVVPAPTSDPELGRTIALDEDDEWDAPVGRSWGAPASAPVEAAGPVRAPRPSSSRTSRVHPVLLVAIYAAVGIGAVVLASTVLLGGSDPSPAAVKTPPVTTKPSATPAAATPVATATPDPVAAAAASNDFTRERTSAVRSHEAAVAAAIADRRRAVRKAKERARLKAEREKHNKRSAANPSPAGSGGGSNYTPPTQTSTPPPMPTRKAPATKRRSVCEFCIG